MKQLNCGVFISIMIILVNIQACNIGCLQCDSAAVKCTACMEGQELTILGDCVKNSITNCNLYLNSSYCLRCSPTYYVQNNTCIKDWSGCYKNLTITKCSTCSPELFLVNGSCFGVFNCLKYTSNSSCSLCDTGFTLVENVCMANTDNCEVVSRKNGLCISCQSNFMLIGYKCIANVYYNPNCYIYDNFGRCSICKDGYILDQSNCYGQSQIQLIKSLNKQYPSINSTDSSSIIQKNSTVNQVNASSPSLQANNSIKSNITQTNSGGIIISKNITTNAVNDNYCKTVLSSICVECYSNFHMEFGLCKVNNPLCRQIYLNGSCKSCYSGYTLQAQTCIIKPVNLTQSVQLINQNKSVLQKGNGTNCLNYQGNQCLECESGYFVNSLGLCILLKANCLKNNLTDGSCLVCLSPYSLINSECIYPTANCLLYNTNSSCYQCSQGYYLQDRTCYPNDITCASYDIIGRCKKCVETYYLVNNACVFPAFGYDSFCVLYTDSYCNACSIGYFLLNYRCTPVDSHCISFDYKSGVCLSCDLNLIISGPNCF